MGQGGPSPEGGARSGGVNGRQVWTTAALCVLLSVGLASLYVASNDGFGSGDLSAMAIWSIPLAIVCARILPMVHRRLWSRALVIRAILLLLTGAVVGLTWTVIVSMLLGGWIFAFSFPVGLIWLIAGGLSGLFIAAVAPAQVQSSSDASRSAGDLGSDVAPERPGRAP